MSIANSLVMEKIEAMAREMALKTGVQENTYIGEAELPAYYFSFGGSVPSDIGYGLLLDKPSKLKKLVYYNLGCEDNFIMTLKIVNYDKKEDIRTFSVNNQRLVLDLNEYPTEGMIGVEIVSSNETQDVFSRHRIILYVQ
jgi:hypothetical protein